MESVEERLNKLREERIAREKLRIDKLRELNLKKYNKNEPLSTPKPSTNNAAANKAVRTDSKPKFDIIKSNIEKCASNPVKNNFHVNGTSKRLVSAPVPVKKLESKSNLQKPISKYEKPLTNNKIFEVKVAFQNNVPKNNVKNFVNSNKIITKPEPKMAANSNMNETKMARKSLAPLKFSQPNLKDKPKVQEISRKSMLPTKVSENRESVFDRLYKPKTVQKKDLNDVTRLQKDPIFLQKVLHQGNLIANKRHTVFEPKTKALPVRRSISAVHFKRISKKELGNCFHKWSSIGEKLNEVHLTNINEDDSVKQDIVTSAIKSERKKVRLQTPSSFNTPRPEELRSRLSNWLKSRGKSIDSYQHLHCFGIHHLAAKPFKPLYLPPEPLDDEENKENIALEHDSDNESYTDNLNDRNNDFNDDGKNKWRSRVSYASDSVCMNESGDTTLNSDEVPVVDDLLLGALNDLTELLREGFDWEQCARWLRAIRERFPEAPRRAAYWECRAALEERRGDLPASVQCWEEAIAKGTQHSVADANLDQLLDKFMQLKISPGSGRRARPDPKLVDIKNVFKSTIIRFAVQQAKLLPDLVVDTNLDQLLDKFMQLRISPGSGRRARPDPKLVDIKNVFKSTIIRFAVQQAKLILHLVADTNLDQLLDKFMQLRISPGSGRRARPDPKLVDIKNVFKSTIIRFAVQQAKLRQSQERPKYTMTPVRRSSRLSCRWSAKKTPLRLCSSVAQAGPDVLFVPNATLCETP